MSTVPNSNNRIVFKHVATSEQSAWLTSSNTVGVGSTYTFSLSTQAPSDYTYLTGIFDQYRCVKVQAWVVPRFQSGTPSASLNPGMLCTVIDYDDGTNLSSLNQAMAYENALTAPGSLGHFREFKPHIALAAYTGSFTGFANAEDEWLDSAYTGVDYFGLKAYINVTDAAYVYDIIIRTHWEFRNQR
jgi:hypothetical protein